MKTEKYSVIIWTHNKGQEKTGDNSLTYDQAEQAAKEYAQNDLVDWAEVWRDSDDETVFTTQQ